jgi:predicted porin
MFVTRDVDQLGARRGSKFGFAGGEDLGASTFGFATGEDLSAGGFFERF